ncbi:MAG: hypothetical protein JWR72_962, partial [Flavisolibacter sp.]|nr:hypothetical protein [Flavisolibacter sp.]
TLRQAQDDRENIEQTNKEQMNEEGKSKTAKDEHPISKVQN